MPTDTWTIEESTITHPLLGPSDNDLTDETVRLVSHDPRIWLVTSYDECAYVQKNEDLFAHPDHKMFYESSADYERMSAVLGGERAVILLQGEEHKLLHRALLRALTERARHGRETLIRSIVENVVGKLQSSGSIEFSREVAELIPSNVIAGIIGMPTENQENLRLWKTWNDNIARCRATMHASDEDLARGHESGRLLNETLEPLVIDRRDIRREDLISDIWSIGEEVFDDWSVQDVISQCRVMFFAGSESTSHFLCNMAYLIFRDPSLRNRLRKEPNLIPTFVEEALRLSTAVQFRMRIAIQDIELGGEQIRAGDRVHTLLSAANRDPQRFDHANQLDLHRSRSPMHMAFNVGPRTCPGAPLARIEGEEVVRSLMARIGHARVDESYPEPVFVGEMNTSFRPLYLVWNE